ncbi:MAG: hypothetical protein CVV30_08625 [Methanomicrobiales archaeon HGW-Methanomicrobiales-1]|jgi:hypothetical protein|nr:MAG: hypothetical protein CVV30_08625 [Methanomicrobiales archaeon HGW-Methanomicrobiales-1]
MVGNYFYHESNIDGKCRDLKGNTYRRIFQQCVEFKRDYYTPYKESQVAITGITKRDIDRKVSILNNYYPHVDAFVSMHRITSQAKFRPTVLEEFCGHLLKDIPEIRRLNLDFFNKGVFAGIVLDREGNAKIKTKDIDFCIGKKFDVNIGVDQHHIIIPVIAIECKTYIDKTMLSEAQFTAQKMKQGSPNVKVYCVSERNEIDVNEIPTKGRTPLDQIFIIRGIPTNPIENDAVFEFFSEIKTALEKISRDVTRIKIGGILPD